jgi:hypothetical protein
MLSLSHDIWGSAHGSVITAQALVLDASREAQAAD